jgi:hypothetical protein
MKQWRRMLCEIQRLVDILTEHVCKFKVEWVSQKSRKHNSFWISTVRPRRWKQYIRPKRPLTISRLFRITSRKTRISTVTILELTTTFSRNRTIPIGQPSLVEEVSVSFCEIRVWHDQHNVLPRPLISVFWTGASIFIQVAPQLSTRGWVDPIPDAIW